MALGLNPELSGVLSDELLREAVDFGYIDAGQYKIQDPQIQPASLDLTLGETAHRLRSSFLPDKETEIGRAHV